MQLCANCPAILVVKGRGVQHPANIKLPAMNVCMWAYYNMVAPSQLAEGKDFLRGVLKEEIGKDQSLSLSPFLFV